MHQVYPDFALISFSILLTNVRVLSFWAFDRNWSVFVTGKKEPSAEMKHWHFSVRA